MYVFTNNNVVIKQHMQSAKCARSYPNLPYVYINTEDQTIYTELHLRYFLFIFIAPVYFAQNKRLQ